MRVGGEAAVKIEKCVLANKDTMVLSFLWLQTYNMHTLIFSSAVLCITLKVSHWTFNVMFLLLYEVNLMSRQVSLTATIQQIYTTDSAV